MENSLLKSLIINNLHEGVYVLDKDGNYIYCNNAFLNMTGGSREEILKINAYDLLAGSKVGHVTISAGVEALKQKRTISFVNEVVTPKKFKYKQLITATPTFDELGNLENVVVEAMRLDLLQARYQQAIAEVEAVKNGGGKIGPMKLTEKATTAIPMIHGKGGAMERVQQELDILAKTDTTILVTGETGTGKEVVTQYIHSCSKRNDKPMVEINCAAFPENLLEAELYGYVKGSFTGARNEGKVGLIESANGGTLFLDEINSMPLPLQSKLLRVLETHKVKRIGDLNEKYIDFRLITATNQDLHACVKNGTFREDLFYRISVVPIHVPPLRERKEDIIPLIEFFLNHFCQQYGIVKTFGPKAIQQMLHYSWPGNVRELRNVIERVVVTGQPSVIEIEQLAETVLYGEQTKSSQITQLRHEQEADVMQLLSRERIDWKDFSLDDYMQRCEKDVLMKALQETGSTYKAAELLKVNQSTVFRKKQRYGL